QISFQTFCSNSTVGWSATVPTSTPTPRARCPKSSIHPPPTTMTELRHPYPNHLLHDISNGSYSAHPLRRGPMYSTYAALRDRKLRRTGAESPAPTFTTPTKMPTANSSLTRSVTDFSIARRKENKKPMETSMTPSPPPPVAPKAAMNRMGSGLVAARRSYSCHKELTELSIVATTAIHEEDKQGKGGNVKSFRGRTTTWRGW
ncbi:unnamed protein product, partial [Musa acuminata subsp. burmannicoides]